MLEFYIMLRNHLNIWILKFVNVNFFCILKQVLINMFQLFNISTLEKQYDRSKLLYNMSIKTTPIKKTFKHVFFTFIHNKKIGSRKQFLPKAKTKHIGPSKQRSKFIHCILTLGICRTQSITQGIFLYSVNQGKNQIN